MKKVKLSIFSSGVGSNLLSIHKATMDKSFPGKLKLVVLFKSELNAYPQLLLHIPSKYAIPPVPVLLLFVIK